MQQLTNASFLNSPFLFVIPVSLTKLLPNVYLGGVRPWLSYNYIDIEVFALSLSFSSAVGWDQLLIQVIYCLIQYLFPYHQITEMVNHYPHCRVTFLETPVYSIYEHRKHKGQTDSEFKKLNNELLSQINELSQNSREINTGLNNMPVFSTVLFYL
jgi:hypothetical protein